MEMVWKNLKGFLYVLILFVVLTMIVSTAVKYTPAPESLAIYYMIGVLCILLSVSGNLFRQSF